MLRFIKNLFPSLYNVFPLWRRQRTTATKEGALPGTHDRHLCMYDASEVLRENRTEHHCIFAARTLGMAEFDYFATQPTTIED
jgi:hypothetical protein